MKKFTNYLMKRLSVLSVLLTACTLTASAYDFMVDSISYNIIGENEVEVTGNDSIKVRGELILPSTVIYDGITYQVKRIGRSAFSRCKELTFIAIPEGVEVICTFAFDGCSSLQYIELPNSLTTIEYHALFGCSSITDFYVPRNLIDIGYNVFSSCSSIRYFSCSPMNPRYRTVDGILYSKDLTTLVAYPPASPETTFDVPTHVTELYDYCLHNCDNLTEINIHEGVTALGMNVFSGCDNIESIYIPDAVTRMGVTLVADCEKLSYIHLPASADSILSSFFYNCPSLIELTIPRNIRYIGTFAFNQCENLKTVNFEEGSRLNEIDLRAFERCYAIETFNMPDSVTILGGQVFGYCTGLKNIHMSNSLKIFAGATFWRCTALTEVDIPGTITFMGNSAFSNCSSLKRVKIGDKNSAPGITYIEDCALVQCDNLERIELGANIDTLDRFALDIPLGLKVFISWATTPPKTTHYSVYPGTNTVLYVPKVALEAYRTAAEWSNFKVIVPIEDVGDVDGDGILGINDVTSLIDSILNNESEGAGPLADVDLDGSIGINDVTSLIDLIMEGN